MSEKSRSTNSAEETLRLPRVIQSHGYVYEDPFKKIEKISADFEGFRKEYFVSDFGPKAAVLVIRGDCLLMARQYRLLINRLSYEVPGGKVDEGESPEESAIRECMEETGVRCRNLKPLISYDPDLEYTRNHTYVYYTEELDEDPTAQRANHEWLSLYQCLEMIKRGVITDSLSLITLMAYSLKKESSV